LADHWQPVDKTVVLRDRCATSRVLGKTGVKENKVTSVNHLVEKINYVISSYSQQAAPVSEIISKLK
jgi:hypothetical protein